MLHEDHFLSLSEQQHEGCDQRQNCKDVDHEVLKCKLVKFLFQMLHVLVS